MRGAKTTVALWLYGGAVGCLGLGLGTPPHGRDLFVLESSGSIDSLGLIRSSLLLLVLVCLLCLLFPLLVCLLGLLLPSPPLSVKHHRNHP